MANPTPRTGRLCESGRHVMDPNWDNCPYCDGERRSKERTRPDQPELVVTSSGGRETKVGEPLRKSGRETKAMPGHESSKSSSVGYSGKGDKRRIVAILITYSWYPEGQLFEIREGKNFIGAGLKSSEAPHEYCEILIDKMDERLSAEHALILCRHGKFEIVDQKSSNGTFVNGEMIPIQGSELPDAAEIKTGSTVWTFMKIRAFSAPNIPSTGDDTKENSGKDELPTGPKKPPTHVP